MKRAKIPYGISNFAMLREEQYLYVDKRGFSGKDLIKLLLIVVGKSEVYAEEG